MLLQRLKPTLVGLLLAACTSQSADPTVSEMKIVGGTLSSQGAWPSAVALVIDKQGSTFLCSGTLVAPSLVVTAAHCVAGRTGNDRIRVYFGNAIRGGREVDGAKAALNPKYPDPQGVQEGGSSPDFELYDAAYVVLSQPVNDVPLVPVLTDKSESATLLAPGTPSTLVGFGNTSEDGSGDINTKYETTTVVGQNDPGGVLFLGGNGKDTCQGDSGGPAFGQLANGQWRVYGITSRGVDCGHGGDYARMSDNLCWIQSDSGQLVPSSTLSCPGLPPPQPTAQQPSGLALALGQQSPTTQDAYQIGASAPKGTAKVALCFNSQAQCLATPSQDLSFQKQIVTGSTAVDLFSSTSMLQLSPGVTVTLLAFDASGRVTASQAVTFNPR